MVPGATGSVDSPPMTEKRSCRPGACVAQEAIPALRDGSSIRVSAGRRGCTHRLAFETKLDMPWVMI